MNDNERELWVDNDESLYNWYRSSHCPMRTFVRVNRREIDKAIRQLLGGK